MILLDKDRYWLLTSRTYGTWLPGATQGFVGKIRDGLEPVIHNLPGTPCDADFPGLRRHAQGLLKCDPILLTTAHANVVLRQFHETAHYRQWQLLAVSVMCNHFHVVAGVPGDPEPGDVLGDFKAYASRALNKRWAKPPSGTWWTARGSNRKLPNEIAIREAADYVVYRQDFPLVTWVVEGLLGEPPT